MFSNRLIILNSSELEVETNIFLKVTPSIVNLGNFVKLTYTIRNAGTTSKQIWLGGTADCMIGNVDAAPIVKVKNTSGKVIGLKMADGLGAAFNIFFRSLSGVTDVDDYWFGAQIDQPGLFGYDSNLTYTVNDYLENSNYDSGLSYSWRNRTLAPDETQVYSIIAGVGNANSVPQLTSVNLTPLIAQTGVVKTFTVSGTYTDPDSDQGQIYYSINSGESVLISSSLLNTGTNFNNTFTYTFANAGNNTVSILQLMQQTLFQLLQILM